MNKNNYLFAFPGTTLILLGVLALTFPKLIIFLLATLLITFGCFALFVAWKLYSFKKQADVMFNQFKTQSFEIRTYSGQSPMSDFETKTKRTKDDIIVH